MQLCSSFQWDFLDKETGHLRLLSWESFPHGPSALQGLAKLNRETPASLSELRGITGFGGRPPPSQALSGHGSIQMIREAAYHTEL